LFEQIPIKDNLVAFKSRSKTKSDIFVAFWLDWPQMGFEMAVMRLNSKGTAAEPRLHG
tara:strand:- start:648018 stop:648191 length:174 start_codon:yes stop_codon:yes gene_type:complete